MRTCAFLERDELSPAAGAVPLRISQRWVPRFPNDRSPSLRIQPLLNSRSRRPPRARQPTPQETQAATSADIARERTGRHSRRDEGTVA
jgi:hypothetical protein